MSASLLQISWLNSDLYDLKYSLLKINEKWRYMWQIYEMYVTSLCLRWDDLQVLQMTYC